jgi:methyl-accepting chemotaxis protein
MEEKKHFPISHLAFELKITLIYVLTSLTGTVFISIFVLSLSRFREKELLVTLLALALDLPVVGFIQWLCNERWFRATRRYLKNPDSQLLAPVHVELLEFPWKGSILSLFLWMITFVVIISSRILFLSPLPTHRTVLLGMAILSGAFLAWPLQYFLFHQTIRSFLDLLPPSPPFQFPFKNIVVKYTLLFGSVLLGATLFGATLFVGTLHDALLNRAYKGIRNLLFLHRQEIFHSPEVHLPKEFSLLYQPSPDAFPAETFLEDRKTFLVVPVFTYELQDLPPTLAFYTPVEVGGMMRYLEYRRSTEDLRQKIGQIQRDLVILCFLLLIFFAVVLALIFLDITRPLRGLLRELPNPDLPYRTPEILLSDDEFMETLLQVQKMFRRFHKLTERISSLFWKIKDTYREITQDFLSFLEFYSEQNKMLNTISQNFSGFRDKTYDQLQLRESFQTSIHEAIQRLPLLLVRWDQQATLVGMMAQGIDSMSKIRNESSSLTAQAYKQLQYLVPRIHQILQGHQLLFSTITRLISVASETKLMKSSEFEKLEIPSQEIMEEKLKEIESLLEQLERFEKNSQIQIQEILRVCEAIDLLGFEALVLSAQGSSDSMEFRVVGDEVRDLASRALNDIKVFSQKLYDLVKETKEELLSLYQLFQNSLPLRQEYEQHLEKTRFHYESFLGQAKGENDIFQFKKRLEEIIHSLESLFSSLQNEAEENLNSATQLFDLIQEEADRHLDLIHRLSSEILLEKTEVNAIRRELENWNHQFTLLEKHLDLLGKQGARITKQLDRFSRHFADLRNLSGQKSEWWSTVRNQLEEIGLEISQREILVKRITQVVGQKI